MIACLLTFLADRSRNSKTKTHVELYIFHHIICVIFLYAACRSAIALASFGLSILDFPPCLSVGLELSS